MVAASCQPSLSASSCCTPLSLFFFFLSIRPPPRSPLFPSPPLSRSRPIPNEGHRPWDLEPGSTMTNAMVTAMVQSNNGHELTLKYKDGAQQVIVPNDIPIVMAEPRSEEHTSELQSLAYLVCRLLLEK